MSKESKQEQLKLLLAAADLSTEDIQQSVVEAQRELFKGQETLQQQAAAPSLPRNTLKSLHEYVASLQRIVDLNHELSQLDLSEGDAPVSSGSDECWKGRLEVTEHVDDKRVLRVSHDTARALPWQVTRIMQLLRVFASTHCFCAGCFPGKNHREALQSGLRVYAGHHSSVR